MVAGLMLKTQKHCQCTLTFCNPEVNPEVPYQQERTSEIKKKMMPVQGYVLKSFTIYIYIYTMQSIQRGFDFVPQNLGFPLYSCISSVRLFCKGV